MLKRIFVDDIYRIFLVLCLLIGKIPLWVIFVRAYTTLSPVAFLYMLPAILIARGYLAMYEQKEFPYAHPIGALISGFFPLIQFAAFNMFVAGILLAFINRDKAGLIIILTCLVLMIIKNILRFLDIKAEYINYGIVKRNAIFHITIFMLWVYFAFSPDGAFMTYASLILIYLFELASAGRLFIPEEKRVLSGNYELQEDN